MSNNIPTLESIINSLRIRYKSRDSQVLNFRDLFGTEFEQAVNREVQAISEEIVKFAMTNNQSQLNLFMDEIEAMISAQGKPEVSSLAEQIIEAVYLQVRLRPDGKSIANVLLNLMGIASEDYWKNIRRAGYLDGAIPRERSTKTAVRLKYKQLTQAIKLYKEAGLFKGQPIKDVLKDYRLELSFREEFDAESPPDLSRQRLELTRLSKSFSLWGDPECDVCIDNQKYNEFLLNLYRISDGYFAPEKVDEHWETDEGPITVRFNFEDHECEFRPTYCQDYLDLRIVDFVNTILTVDRKFEMYSDANEFVILFITKNQKQRLIEELEFPFNTSKRT